jgi:cellulose synthase/poly-beta-1,6-N-acetylglucosamine synthase-like glycosyltransferase
MTGEVPTAMDWPVLGFWVGLFVPLISYLLYPVGVILLGRRARPSSPDSLMPWPDVTVAIAAHNEEASIERAVRSILAQAYEGPAVKLLIGLDGCTDRTAEVLAAIGEPRLRVLNLPRVGKATTDNRLAAAADTEVVVKTDAGSEFAPGTLARLVAPLRDGRIGCATGVFRPRADGTDSSEGEGLYWRLEYRVMDAESRLGILAMASGTALAFRRSAFRPIPADSDADVTVAPTVALLGSRVVHVPDAIVYDDGPTSFGAVLRNRRRMALRALPATLGLVPRLLLAGRFGASISLISHKLFRWLTPVAALVWALSAVALVVRGDPGYVPVVAALAGVGMLGAIVGALNGRTRGAMASLAVAQLAFSLALVDVIRGRRARTWSRGPE